MFSNLQMDQKRLVHKCLPTSLRKFGVCSVNSVYLLQTVFVKRRNIMFKRDNPVIKTRCNSR